MHISDFEIQALIDGELDEHAADTLFTRIKDHPAALKRYCELLKQKELLKLWWTHQRTH